MLSIALPKEFATPATSLLSGSPDRSRGIAAVACPESLRTTMTLAPALIANDAVVLSGSDE